MNGVFETSFSILNPRVAWCIVTGTKRLLVTRLPKAICEYSLSFLREVYLKYLIRNFKFVLSSRDCRSQWPCGPRRRSAAARLLKLWVRIPLGAWMFVCCECFVLSGRGFCDDLITRSEESYRLWCVVVCDLETS